MHFKIPSLFLDIACLLIGAVLPLAFAPFDYYLLAILLPALLIPFWQHTQLKRVFLRGFLFGLGFFSVGASWVFVSIHLYGNAPVALAGFLTAIFVLTLAMFPAVQALIFRILFPFPNFAAWCLGFPALWAISEWFRTWFLSGFPWNFLSYSQIDSPLAGFVPILGVYGTSALIIFIGGIIAYAILWKENWQKTAISTSVALILLFIGMSLRHIEWTQYNQDTQQVSLIQGNIPQEQKWDKAFIENIIKKYIHLTDQHWDSTLIVWPEAALPIPLPQSLPILNLLDQNAKQHHSTLIMGLLDETNNQQFYNAAIAIGEGKGLYHKRQLVPFGEYVPFENYLRNLIAFFNLPTSHTTAGAAKQPILTEGQWKIAPLICYEIAYPNLARESALDGNIILTISNDTWFGQSLGPKQHLQIAQFRALETGRYIMRATNTGITAFINPKGEIISKARAYETTVLTAIIDTTRGNTPIILFGHLSIIIGLFVILGLGIGFSKRKKVWHIVQYFTYRMARG